MKVRLSGLLCLTNDRSWYLPAPSQNCTKFQRLQPSDGSKYSTREQRRLARGFPHWMGREIRGSTNPKCITRRSDGRRERLARQTCKFQNRLPRLLVESMIAFRKRHKLKSCTCSHAALDVGKKLFSLFALALDLPETYFDDKVVSTRTGLAGRCLISPRLYILPPPCVRSIIRRSQMHWTIKY